MVRSGGRGWGRGGAENSRGGDAGSRGDIHGYNTRVGSLSNCKSKYNIGDTTGNLNIVHVMILRNYFTFYVIIVVFFLKGSYFLEMSKIFMDEMI